MAAQIVSPPREDRVELAVVQVQRHEHAGVRVAADVERDRLARWKQHAA